MRMGSAAKVWFIALLVIIAAGVSWLASKLPPDGDRLFGGFFLVVGAMNVLFHRRFGRQVYRKAHSMSPFVSRPWDSVGEKGIQVLYLGIGIIFAVVGCVLLIRSA
jgi:uncharacterized membrane protein YfcA